MNGRSLEGLRILHVHTLPVVSGSGINTFLSMKGSQGQGAHVALACAPGGRLEEKVRDAGMDFFPIPAFSGRLDPARDLKAALQLDQLLRRQRFEVIHTHNSKAGFLGRLAARRLRHPVVIHTVHGFSFHEEESLPLRHLFIRLERRAARWCNRLIGISQPMIDWGVRERIAPREKFVKIYSGIEVDRFRTALPDPWLMRQLGIEPGDFVIGHVSKLWEGKGHDVLLEAAALLAWRGHRFKILLVGEGALESSLRDQVEKLNLGEHVVFTGFVEDVPSITALLDISVLPSLYEGMGRVVLEAMAAGKPVVASRVGGLPDLVDHDRTGFLVPPGDAETLAARIQQLLEDGQKRQEMGRQGARKVREEYSSEYMVEQIHQVYCQELATS